MEAINAAQERKPDQFNPINTIVKTRTRNKSQGQETTVEKIQTDKETSRPFDFRRYESRKESGGQSNNLEQRSFESSAPGRIEQGKGG